MTVSFLSLSLNSWGERVGVRGEPSRKFFISPLTFVLSPQGERNIEEAYFFGDRILPKDPSG
jgi:hypothetical protein